MQRYYRLEDAAYLAGGNRLVKFDSLPTGKRVRELILHFTITGTKTAGVDALDGALFAQFVSMLQIGSYFHLPGWETQELDKQVYGSLIDDPVDIAAAGAVFSAVFDLRIPFRDPRQPASDDGSMPTDVLRENAKALEITFASATVHGVGTLTATAGTVNVLAELVDETDIPQLCQIGFVDPGSLTYTMEPGYVIKDLFVVDGPSGAGSITTAEIASLDMEVDGGFVWNNATHEQIVSAFNGNGVRENSGAITAGAASRLPLVWHDWAGKANLTKQPVIEKGGRVQLVGTIAAPRYVYWRVIPKTPEAVARLAKTTGAPPEATTYQPSTVTKTAPMALERSAKQGSKTKKLRVMESTLKGKLRAPGFTRQ